MEEETSPSHASDMSVNDAHSNVLAFADAAISRLRLRNSLLPVARLPNEVLCCAFTFLDLCCCISASAVCHHWREVCVGFALLWSHLDFIDDMHLTPDAAASLIARSRNVDLDLRCNLGFYDAELEAGHAFLPTLRDNMHRVSSLVLNDEVGIYAPRLFGDIQLPRLRSLCFSTVFKCMAFDQAAGTSMAQELNTPPINISAILKRCPNLRRLHLTDLSRLRVPATFDLPNLAWMYRAYKRGGEEFSSPVDLDSVVLDGGLIWVGLNVLPILRNVRHILLTVRPLPLFLLFELPTFSPIEELALVADEAKRLLIAVRDTADRTRTFIDPTTLRYGANLPGALLRLASWTRNLVSLTLVDTDWFDVRVVPAEAPLLQYLTVIVRPNIVEVVNDSDSGEPHWEEDDAQLYDDDNVFSWRCPSLRHFTICAHERNKGIARDVADLEDERLVVFLRDILGIARDRKLENLSLVNVALVDSVSGEYLGVKRQRGSALRLTAALELVRTIEMQIDFSYTGRPNWWKDGLGSSRM
ncbi:hypothetical protein EXIGLDRAFT_839808 [Exidia glandulosa HHB12029]|uniref:F-box domain-containing protein n=1 Tax=Exidia glandulosa HHB12029 TaxID=1314781 RepID=A0A165ETC1_EXIGL|nr:hypothetical protein EXIGLDRAFT_839808 [Exidia glandulosa HHB12029]